jgi:RNA polymerase-binding transcription factor
MNDGTVAARQRDLRQILLDRRREIEGDVRARIREARADRPEALGDGDHSDAAMQEGIDFALIQLKTETLARIDAALVRLDEGTYGNCFECGAEISGKRLRALPFAARCTACEEKREQQVRTRKLAQQQADLTFFPPM